MIRTASFIAGLLCASVASATLLPQAAGPDPRVRIVRYQPDDVVRFDGILGFSTTVQFGPGERIENVSIGDALGWQVTPNRKATLLFLKPVEPAAPTNMTVVTNLRAYNFELRVHRATRGAERAAIFSLRFDYPEAAVVALQPSPPPAPPEPPRDINHAYSFKGSDAGLPTRVFDDGRSTYFQFAENIDIPAVYALEDGDKEAVVNVSQKDGYLIVDRLARGFVLRRGAQSTRIINGGYRESSVTSALPRRKDR